MIKTINLFSDDDVYCILLKNYNYINIFIDIIFTCHLRMFREIYNSLITE